MTQRLDPAVAAGGMKALAGVRAYLGGALPRDLVDLVYLRVSQINGCAYCIDMHGRDLREQDYPVEKLLLLPVWREAKALFSEREQAALVWSEHLTRLADDTTGEGVADAVYEAVRAVFDERETADLTLAVGLMNAYNRIGVGLRLTPVAVKRA